MLSVDGLCSENPRRNALRRKKNIIMKKNYAEQYKASVIGVPRLRKSMTDALHSAYPYHSSIFYLIKIQTHCRSLGMCKRCGDLRIVACSQCKGIGSVRKGGMLNLGMLDDLYESLGAEAKTDNLIPCTKCRSKGRLLCPECSKIAWPFNNMSGARKYKAISMLINFAALMCQRTGDTTQSNAVWFFFFMIASWCSVVSCKF